MAFQTKQKSVKELQREVELLRSFVIGVAGKDREGAYRPQFVRMMLGAVNEKPTHTFKNKESFLAQLRKFS